MLPDDPHTKAAALLQSMAQELGPRSSWQQVGPPAAGEVTAATAATLGLYNRPTDSHGIGTLGPHDWCNTHPGDDSPAAVAAAAVAAVLGADAYNGVVSNGYSNWSGIAGLSSNYHQQPELQESGVSNGGPYGLCNSSLNNSFPGGSGLDSSWQGSGNRVWGNFDLVGYSNPWATNSRGTNLLQQQAALEAFLNAGATQSADAPSVDAPTLSHGRLVSPQHLAVGGPTHASSSNSSCRSHDAHSPARQLTPAGAVGVEVPGQPAGSLTSSPGSRSSSSGAGVNSEEASSRMAAFMWADNLGIWGPPAQAGQR